MGSCNLWWLVVGALVVGADWLPDLKGDYCRTGRTTRCCNGRVDTCAVPILGTLCYCDTFCNRTTRPDCCPDYFEVCLGIVTSSSAPIIQHECVHEGRRYNLGTSLQSNCNKCTCKLRDDQITAYLSCETNVCLVDPGFIINVNQGRYGWTASNYSFFWGKTLREGIVYRLGTFRPSNRTRSMKEIRIKPLSNLPPSFDARQKWPGQIQAVRNQGDCGASWAFSTTALASDRLAIQSMGKERITLSPQQMVSCQTKRQKACHGGHLDRAWWYLRKHGVTEESCFPYRSGWTPEPLRCHVRRVRKGRARCEDGQERYLHRWTPPYKIPPKEEAIMTEIFTNGPVQVTFKVTADFFMYRGGVYNSLPQLLAPSQRREVGWHSVRIIGWGVDRTHGYPVNYWLCANSWGRQWGEDGLFRIVRGANEGEFESFVVGVWARHHRHRPGLDLGRSSNVIGSP